MCLLAPLLLIGLAVGIIMIAVPPERRGPTARLLAQGCLLGALTLLALSCAGSVLLVATQQ